VQRLPLSSGRDGRFFSGIDATCIYLNVSGLPSKYIAKMGNRQAVTRRIKHSFDERTEKAGYCCF
jgi:hypothetical protein